MDEAKLRAWWSHRQALDGRLAGAKSSDILAQTGWARSVGGVNPYLTLFARGGVGRQAADAEVAQLAIHELPAARGCTYVVPACDFGLALKAGFGFANEGRTARKLGVTDSEIERLCAAVADALAGGPLDPQELRTATGGAVRNLGEEGKKKGLSSTLPVALERLQSIGEIRRIPVNGRLDQQRYRYALWRPNPLEGFRLTEEEVFTELAGKFFSWTGPATMAEFQWFSGLGSKDARAAVSALNLKPLEDGSDLLMFVEHREQLRSFKPSKKPQYVLVSSLDGISHLRRNVESLLAPEDMSHSAFCERGLTDLSSHAILDRGRLTGLWEYDVSTESIAWTSFVPRSRQLDEAVAHTETYVREQLGDARSFSLDTPKSRAPRIAILRKAHDM